MLDVRHLDIDGKNKKNNNKDNDINNKNNNNSKKKKVNAAIFHALFVFAHGRQSMSDLSMPSTAGMERRKVLYDSVGEV
jgi:hypothetical protein